jgi:hypothetical protein
MNASQTGFSAAFVDCMRTLDVALMRKLWKHVFPHLPQVDSDEEALATLHHARTQSDHIVLKLRAYSHRWLLERSIPSGLPDEMRQSAERMYPVITRAVGISVNSRNPILKPIMGLVRESMENAVLEAHADGRIDDSPFVTERMAEARNQTMRKLLGRIEGKP